MFLYDNIVMPILPLPHSSDLIFFFFFKFACSGESESII